MKLWSKSFIFCLLQVLIVQPSAAPKTAKWDTASWRNLIKVNAKKQKTEISKTIQDINVNVGLVAAEAALIINDGFLKKRKSKTSAQMRNKTYYNADFLTSNWLQECSDLLSTGQPPYEKMNSFNSGSLPEMDRNYVNIHLIPALNNLSQSTHSYVDTTGFKTNVTFTPGSFNGVVVTGIHNNTTETFSIFQKGAQIGALKPGYNNVALYGAASSQGDVIFMPETKGKGMFRISCKQGFDIVAIANTVLSSSQQYSTEAPPVDTGAEFICVQITGNDFPSTATEEVKNMFTRNQCINTSELTFPAALELKIEDNVSVINQGKVQNISQSAVSLFYPSISSMTLLNQQTFPYLVLPLSLQRNGLINGWIDFINIVIGALQSNFEILSSPKNILKVLKDASQKLHVIKEKNNDFSSVSSPVLMRYKHDNVAFEYQVIEKSKVPKPIKTIIAGLPGTNYFFTPDIPDKDMLSMYLMLQTTGVSKGQKHIYVNPLKNLSFSNFLKQADKHSSFIQNFWNSIIAAQHALSVKQVSAGKFVMRGKTGFANKIAAYFKKNPFVEVILSKIPIVKLANTRGRLVEFKTSEVVNLIKDLAAGKHSVYLKPVVDHKVVALQGQGDLSQKSVESSKVESNTQALKANQDLVVAK